MGKQAEKKPYAIALPNELPSSVGNVEGYSRIPKTGTIMATTPRGAVSEYLHRKDIVVPNSNLIIDKLNKTGGVHRAGAYAFDLSDIETRDEKDKVVKTTPQDRAIAEEALLSHFLSRTYGGKDTSYLGKARELLRGFRNQR